VEASTSEIGCGFLDKGSSINSFAGEWWRYSPPLSTMLNVRRIFAKEFFIDIPENCCAG
jgi:hypothetical protein